MRTFASDNLNDLALSGNSLSVLTGISAIESTARHYMQARRGEMFLAVPDGVPFDALAWGGEPNIAQFEAAGRARLLQVPGVVEVLSFEARLVNDELRYIATFSTESGEGSVSG